MQIVHAGGLAGARSARGTVVVIDVLRAFTVSAYALAGGAVECRLVAQVAEARALATRIPGAVLSAEVDGLPVEGIAISNSPTMVRAVAVAGRTLVQRTSAGTQCTVAATGAERLYVGSLVVAAATAAEIARAAPEIVTLVAAGEDRHHPEDRACARYLEGLLRGAAPDLQELLAPLWTSPRAQQFAAGEWPGFPASDLELSLTPNRFGFAMPVSRDALGLRVTAS